jgi:hypothetical protein
MFRRAGTLWTPEATLVDWLPAGLYDKFGSALAVSGNSVVIARGGLDDAKEARVYTYDGGGWPLDAILTPTTNWTWFGWPATLIGDTAVMGSSGPMLTFKKIGDMWVEQQAVLDVDSIAVYEEFGDSLAFDGVTILAGAPGYDDAAGENFGAVWFFNAVEEDFVLNKTKDTLHTTISDAIGTASSADVIIAGSKAFKDNGPVNMGPLALTLASNTSIVTPAGSDYILTTNSILSYTAGFTADFHGALVMQPGSLLRSPGGTSPTTIHSILDISYATINANTIIDGLGAASIDSAATIVGDLTNNGITSLNGGSLLISGALTNNGVIDDGLPASRATGGELRAGGDLVLGASATLTPSTSGALVSTAGSYDAAINDNTRYAMATNELRMDGTSTHTLELMSTDIGNDADGLNPALPGHYPLGTLRIGPNSATINLIDTHDNDGLGQSAKEAIYTDMLIIDPGTTLNTNACVIYYNTLALNGSVDDPANLIQLAPPCPTDLNNDGTTDGADLGLFLANWGNPGQTDLNGDGGTDGADLGLFLAAWGACP